VVAPASSKVAIICFTSCGTERRFQDPLNPVVASSLRVDRRASANHHARSVTNVIRRRREISGLDGRTHQRTKGINGDRMALKHQPRGLEWKSEASCYEIRTIANYAERVSPCSFSDERARLGIKYLMGQGLSTCSDFVTSPRCINFSPK
jgi:hypothetical protein